MERSIERELQALCNKAWKAILKSDADVSGISDHVRKKYPFQWEQMNDDKIDVLNNSTFAPRKMALALGSVRRNQ
jgi:hypothetical protein